MDSTKGQFSLTNMREKDQTDPVELKQCVLFFLLHDECFHRLFFFISFFCRSALRVLKINVYYSFIQTWHLQKERHRLCDILHLELKWKRCIKEVSYRQFHWWILKLCCLWSLNQWQCRYWIQWYIFLRLPFWWSIFKFIFQAEQPKINRFQVLHCQIKSVLFI